MSAPRVVVTVCDTCRHPDGEKEKDGVSGGARFAEAVEAAAEAVGDSMAVRRHSCLMGCKRHCAAALSAPDGGKMTYVLGDFEPSAEAADALTRYAALYAESDTGVVDFKSWPEGVKGKFLARVPPL